MCLNSHNCYIRAAALKCNVYRFESLLVEHLDKGSVQCEGVCTGGEIFLIHH